MIDVETLKNFLPACVEFEETCYHIAEKLEVLNHDYWYVSNWVVREDDCTQGVWWIHGRGTAIFHDNDYDIDVRFPAILLAYSDEELDQYIAKELERREQKEEGN